MRAKFALPVLGALALLAALPAPAEARRRSSFDVSVGFGYSSYGGHRGYGRSYYDSDVSFRYSRGRDYGYSRYGGGYDRPRYYRSYPRYYAPRPIYRDSYYYRPTRRYYRDHYYDRPVYRRYYYRDDYCY
jgi:hypothetical protein